MFEEERLESEPFTKKPKLEPPDHPDVTPKLETADPNWELGSDVEVSTSYISSIIGAYMVLHVLSSL